MKNKVVTKHQLISEFIQLGISKGDVINAKVSLRSIGFVQGGAMTVLEALREAVGDEGLIVADAFVRCYRLPLSSENEGRVSAANSLPYTGAFARAVVENPDSHRAMHPILRYALVGRDGARLAANFNEKSEPYGLISDLIDSGGKHLKIGDIKKVPDVGTTHLAIERIGLSNRCSIPPLGVNFQNSDGNIELFERDWLGGCAQGFNNLVPAYRDQGGVIAEGLVGAAPTMLTSMARTYAIDWEQIKNDPTIILCTDKTCFRCRRFWKFSDCGPIRYAFNYAKAKILYRISKFG